MARSRITTQDNDLSSDAGSILLSFIEGEQLEFEAILDFIVDASTGYDYEAVIIEALNTGDGEVPTAIRPAGVQHSLEVVTPVYRGAWDSGTTYNGADVVLYNGTYYALDVPTLNSTTTPNLDPIWLVTSRNRIYARITSDVGTGWSAPAPTPDKPVYGFFEIRVSENTGSFRRTWKPVRGMAEILFSPTAQVPDV